ncbi:hypothetical protein KIH23_07240 [Flavobacterium sp. CYK-55]|uniref:hypothetical protein n=1 Tax=Flavobacterium sp. CYK-55 TaxID=2835529 RepID=UPI001BCCAE1D|nr:hypothetical protein [Flavobacterium sp. CYK-55]MBS7787088.1 hypothetical protein [Flavobacterium sp. CYK-55]
MNYYIIQWSLNTQVMGHLPQVSEVILNGQMIDDPNFIDRFHFQKIETTPITSYPVLEPKSNLTDLIQVGSMGFTNKILISNHLKSILEKNSAEGLQFIRTSVYWRGIEKSDFWLVHPYVFQLNMIDFSRSEVYLTEMVLKKIEQLKIASLDEFLKAKQEIEERGFPYGIKIDKLALNTKTNLGFFALGHIEGGVKFLVSAEVKQAIEISGCTGIEFRPAELSYNEWLKPGGEREKQYGKF